MIHFAAGLVVGSLVGILTTCLCQAAGQADESTGER